MRILTVVSFSLLLTSTTFLEGDAMTSLADNERDIQTALGDKLPLPFKLISDV